MKIKLMLSWFLGAAAPEFSENDYFWNIISYHNKLRKRFERFKQMLYRNADTYCRNRLKKRFRVTIPEPFLLFQHKSVSLYHIGKSDWVISSATSRRISITSMALIFPSCFISAA